MTDPSEGRTLMPGTLSKMTSPMMTDFRTKTLATRSTVTFHKGKIKITQALTRFQTTPTASRATMTDLRSEIRRSETRTETTDFQTMAETMMAPMEASSLRKISKIVNNLATTISKEGACHLENLIRTRTIRGRLAILASMPETNNGATQTMATISREAGWLAPSSADASRPLTTHQRDI